ncbi:hypothetical protein EX895_000656 [Sporisorium graminicola]|uniref:Uncharacterized protein n=1 Tax=Sporisorium graminicola TaxID=280036 RepID=A0A4U7L3Z9_9BASI|nr:hypothetical protein EX895_000656 [Sporisorium graminicola]TKY90658.1 hypothetical protein EX895_000656 [Sporisorium graminicola]
MPTAAHRSGDGPSSQGVQHSSQHPLREASPVTSSAAVATATATTAAAAAASPSSPFVARHSPKARPRTLNNQHHPYRIELLDLTPVSVSLLWSTRPPPLSAIPLEAINTQLRKRVKARGSSNAAHRSSSPGRTSARATAVSPSPTSTTAAAASKSRGPATAQASDRSANNASNQSLETPISKLTDGLVATRSLNRKVTKIRLRAPPPVAVQHRRSSNSSAPSDSAHNSANDDDASDDGAAAAEDEIGSASDASDSGYEGTSDTRHHVTSVFKDRVSIIVNGHDWSHVLLGERGSHEAIVVIFGLEPESDYDIQFLVKAGLDGTHDAFRATLRTRAERDSPRSIDSAPAVRSASPSPLGRLPVSAPEVDVVEAAPRRLAVLQAELDASEAHKAALLAEVKRARKESSKHEAGLRHEIDAVKRGMDRMSATDHRSRQKVLALQELIKQTTVHTKEIHEQAELAEKEQPQWEEQDANLEVQVETLLKQVEAEEAAAQAEWDKDDAALAALEKDLRSLEASAKALEIERDELRDDKLASIQSEIERVKEQSREALARPPGGLGANARRGGAAVAGSQRGGHRHASGPHAPLNAAGHKGKPGGRGGKMAGFGNRAVSGPAGQFGGPGNNSSNSTGFAGASRGFMQSFGKGFRRGQHQNQQTQSFDAMAGTNYAPGAASQQGSMLPSGQAYLPDQSAMGMGGFGANGTYATLDSFYSQAQTQPTRFPSGASEVSQDDLYDPTLGFDPYDPSIDARRRSSLPIPQVSYNPPQPRLPASSTTTTLNPANPEFVPSTGSNHESPVISKNPSASSASAPANKTSAASTAVTAVTSATALPAHAAIATQSPPPGVASVEHSPTSSSRFAFPLARHLPTSSISSNGGGGGGGSGGGAASSLTSKSSSSALASPPGASANPNNILNLPLGSDLSVPPSGSLGSSLFSMGAPGTASPFSRHSPLLAQGLDGSTGSAGMTGFAGASPRFGQMGLQGHAIGLTGNGRVGGDDLTSSSAPFGTSSKFGPLDYDPSLDNFGPAPGLSGGLSSAPGANAPVVATGGLPPFSSSTMSSIFGAADTWSPPVSNASTSGWITSSPPLGSGGGSGSGAGGAGAGSDIWTAPGLPGVSQLRTKLSLTDLASQTNASPSGSPAGGNAAVAGAAPFGAFGNARLGALGSTSVPNRSSPLASPVTATSPAVAVAADRDGSKDEKHETQLQ